MTPSHPILIMHPWHVRVPRLHPLMRRLRRHLLGADKRLPSSRENGSVSLPYVADNVPSLFPQI